MEQNLSDSKVQRDIEKEVLFDLMQQNPDWQQADWLNLVEGRELAKKVKPDAVWKDEQGKIIIVECYVRIDKLKPGHRRKIATDILKLISLRNEFGEEIITRLLLVVPEELGQQLESDDWLSIVIRKELELFKVSLTDEQRQRLREAVKRQGEGQARRGKGEEP